MTVRIIPGAVGATTARALVLSDERDPPELTLADPRGAPLPGLTLRPHASGDPRFDQHLVRAGVRLFVAEAARLTPATDYLLGGAHVRTFPRRLPAKGLTLAVASCFSDQFGGHADYLRVLQGAAGHTPLAAKLLVGDNVYIDVGRAPGQARTGFEETVDRYLQYFWRSGYADVLAYLPTFTLWDDHEFWNNYPERQPWLARSLGSAMRADYSAAALLGVKTFQAVLNPVPAARSGLSYRFELPPLSLFALDLRAGRTLQSAAIPRMCTEVELQAFERWAAGLKGPGALLVGQPLWIEPGKWTDFNPPAFAAQYARIWRALAAAPWDIVVISGDVHHSHLLEIDVGADRRVWQLVSSPVCHIPTQESIAAGAFDQQGSGAVHLPAAIVVDRAVCPEPPTLRAYHCGTGCPNSLALLRVAPAADGGVDVSGTFVDVKTKIAAPWTAPPPGIPVAPGARAWCQGDPLFTLRRRC
jgi:hypothetical protein